MNLEKAYELAQKGDSLGAARECEAAFARDESFVSAIEGLDFWVGGEKPEDALRFARAVDKRVAFYRARIEFFRGLALMDLGRTDEAKAALRLARLLGYNNEARLRIELGRRMSPDELNELLLITPRASP
jgi:tetratricopeptide (TPR) repeat protein